MLATGEDPVVRAVSTPGESRARRPPAVRLPQRSAATTVDPKDDPGILLFQICGWISGTVATMTM
jgi:hypothetical protein